jgi:hypothetical protein
MLRHRAVPLVPTGLADAVTLTGTDVLPLRQAVAAG